VEPMDKKQVKKLEKIIIDSIKIAWKI
jgi:hypothetical protein